MSGPHECDSQHKLDSSWTNTIGIGWSQSFPHHVNAVDHSAIKILEQRLVLSLIQSIFAQLSQIVTMALVCTTSPEQHKSPWFFCLHHFIDSRQVIFHCLDGP